MNYAKEVIDSLGSSATNLNDPSSKAKEIMSKLSYVKEKIIPNFFKENGNEISRIYELSKNDYFYKSKLKGNAIDSNLLLEKYHDHFLNLYEFTENTIKLKNDDVLIESVQDKLPKVEEATKRAIEKAIGQSYYEQTIPSILSNTLLLVEICKDTNKLFNEYQNVIENATEPIVYSGTGEYESIEKEYASHLLESTKDIMCRVIINGFDSLSTVKDLSNVNVHEYTSEKNKPRYQLF